METKSITLTLTADTYDKWIKFCRTVFSCKNAGKNNGANKITSELVEKYLIKIMEGKK